MTPFATINSSSTNIDLQKQFTQLFCNGPLPQNQIGMMPAGTTPVPQRGTLHLNNQQKKRVIKAPT